MPSTAPKFILSLARGNENPNNTTNLLSSSYVYLKKHDLNLENISNNMFHFSRQTLLIVRVFKDGTQEELENKEDGIDVAIYKGNTQLLVVRTISEKNFFGARAHIDSTLKLQDERGLQVIYVFDNYSWLDLKLIFTSNHITISGGNSTKRHMFSPVQARLAQFLLYLDKLSIHGVVQSFHHTDTSFHKSNLHIDSSDKRIVAHLKNAKDQDRESEVREHLDRLSKTRRNVELKGAQASDKNFNVLREARPPLFLKKSSFNKKSFHTSASLSNKVVKKSHVNTGINYLEVISDIVKGSKNDPVLAQKRIETSWVDSLRVKFEDDKFTMRQNLAKVVRTAEESLIIHAKRGYLKKRFGLLEEIILLNSKDCIVHSFTLILVYLDRASYTSIAITLGNRLLFVLYMKSTNLSDSFNEYKSIHGFTTTASILKLGVFFIDLLSEYPTDVFEKQYKNNGINEMNESATLEVNSDYVSMIKENLILHPSSLPMVCEPNKWGESEYGGFLENMEQQIDVVTGSNRHKHELSERTQIYKAINTMSSTKFAINLDLLDYIYSDKGKYLIEEELDTSSDIQREMTLNVAKVYSGIPFYLNVHADWRGRLYTQSFFLSYQGGDLSSSLLNFWEGAKLTDSGKEYLYIHGANAHNANDIGKSSFTERIKWVKTNYDRIISMDKELILKAESKFVFTAFCLALKELHKNPESNIKIPVVLDATCSGIQHLAGLLRDFDLGSKVNLTFDENIDKVGDIYSEMLQPINKAINDYGLNNPNYGNLSLVKLNRKNIKQSIMTKTYNASIPGMVEQIKDKLIKKTEKYKWEIKDLELNKDGLKPKTKTTYITPGIDGTVELTEADIYKIATILNQQIFVAFPSLKSIYDYLLSIVRLMIKANIPLTWFIPKGAKILQSYSNSVAYKVPLTFRGKSKSVILREWDNTIDSFKQVQAIIPNIIHSLDATHLVNILNSAKEIGLAPVISVHDCFGTHPNQMSALSHQVKKEFVLLYSQEEFLSTFHDRIMQSITDNGYQTKMIRGINRVMIGDKWHKVPVVPKLGELDLQRIMDAKYMIS